MKDLHLEFSVRNPLIERNADLSTALRFARARAWKLLSYILIAIAAIALPRLVVSGIPFVIRMLRAIIASIMVPFQLSPSGANRVLPDYDSLPQWPGVDPGGDALLVNPSHPITMIVMVIFVMFAIGICAWWSLYIIRTNQPLATIASLVRNRKRIRSGGRVSNITIRRADFAGRRLHDMSFDNCDLSQSNFSWARLQRSNWLRSTLISANFYGAQCNEATFTKANLTRAVMAHAQLQGASFKKATITGISLFRANIAGIILDDSDLRGADLSGAIGMPQSMKRVRRDDQTIIPVNWEYTTRRPSLVTRGAALAGIIILTALQSARLIGDLVGRHL